MEEKGDEEDTRIYVQLTALEEEEIQYFQEQTVEWVSDILKLTGGFGEVEPSQVQYSRVDNYIDPSQLFQFLLHLFGASTRPLNWCYFFTNCFHHGVISIWNVADHNKNLTKFFNLG